MDWLGRAHAPGALAPRGGHESFSRPDIGALSKPGLARAGDGIASHRSRLRDPVPGQRMPGAPPPRSCSQTSRSRCWRPTQKTNRPTHPTRRCPPTGGSPRGLPRSCQRSAPGAPTAVARLFATANIVRRLLTQRLGFGLEMGAKGSARSWSDFACDELLN